MSIARCCGALPGVDGVDFEGRLAGMPYADKEKQRAAQAEWLRKKRAANAAFRDAENAERVQRAQANPEANRQAVQRWREANPEAAKVANREASKRWRAKKKTAASGRSGGESSDGGAVLG